MNFKKINQREEIPLDSATRHILEECRMVMPGIQALFGFQLIAVFNEGFANRLGPAEQRLHLLSIIFVVLSIALVMAPAAIHRISELCSVSGRFIVLSSQLLLWGMFPLAIGICLEVYLIAKLILMNPMQAKLLSLILFMIFLIFWIGLPLLEREHIQRKK
jgi:hypothetical protein